MSILYIAGEDIAAGASVVVSLIDGKVYSAGETAGTYIADAAENLREGFRVVERDGEMYEDDA